MKKIQEGLEKYFEAYKLMLHAGSREQQRHLFHSPGSDDAYIINRKGFIQASKHRSKRPYNNIYDYAILEDHQLLKNYIADAQLLKPVHLSIRRRVDDSTMLYVKICATKLDKERFLMKVFYGKKLHLRNRFKKYS